MKHFAVQNFTLHNEGEHGPNERYSCGYYNNLTSSIAMLAVSGMNVWI